MAKKFIKPPIWAFKVI